MKSAQKIPGARQQTVLIERKSVPKTVYSIRENPWVLKLLIISHLEKHRTKGLEPWEEVRALPQNKNSKPKAILKRRFKQMDLLGFDWRGLWMWHYKKRLYVVEKQKSEGIFNETLKFHFYLTVVTFEPKKATDETIGLRMIRMQYWPFAFENHQDQIASWVEITQRLRACASSANFSWSIM